MKSGGRIWTERLIAEIDQSVRTIVARKFPDISFADREDVLQEVQFKIWKMLTSGKKIDRLESYLWKVVFTTTLAVIGDKLKAVSLDDLGGGANGPVPGGKSADPAFEEMERRELLDILVGRLSQKRRLVVKCHLAGMDLEKTAAHLGWTVPKVRHLLYRSIKELRKFCLASALEDNEQSASRKEEVERRMVPVSESGDAGEVLPE